MPAVRPVANDNMIVLHGLHGEFLLLLEVVHRSLVLRRHGRYTVPIRLRVTADRRSG